jgi:hypothetical protein
MALAIVAASVIVTYNVLIVVLLFSLLKSIAPRTTSDVVAVVFPKIYPNFGEAELRERVKVPAVAVQPEESNAALEIVAAGANWSIPAPSKPRIEFVCKNLNV